MNDKFICSILKCTSLENYIISVLNQGQEIAITKSNEFIIIAKESIPNTTNEEHKINALFVLLTAFKQEFTINNHNYLKHFIDESKNYIYENKEENQFSNVARYILEYYKFLNISDLSIISKLKKIKQDSYNLFLDTKNYENCQFFFEELKEIESTKNYEWNFSNLESNIFRFYINQNEKQKLAHKRKIEEILYNQEKKNNNFEDEIKSLKREVISAKNEAQSISEFHNKYYYANQPFIQETVFGDNQPFIKDLFNFLKVNKSLDCGWSYFYNCMVIGNTEIINLNKKKTYFFLGYLFYRLGEHLVNDFREDPKTFFLSKFQINNKPLPKSFLKNNIINRHGENNFQIKLIADFFNKTQIVS